MAALGTRSLVLTIGGTDYTAQCSRVEITTAEADSAFVSYADASNGGAREYTLEFTAYQDFAAATGLWDKIWTAAGTTVAFIAKPYGNATATAAQPHFSGNAIITEADGVLIGGSADTNATAKQTFDGAWVCTAKPTRVVV